MCCLSEGYDLIHTISASTALFVGGSLGDLVLVDDLGDDDPGSDRGFLMSIVKSSWGVGACLGDVTGYVTD